MDAGIDGSIFLELATYTYGKFALGMQQLIFKFTKALLYPTCLGLWGKTLASFGVSLFRQDLYCKPREKIQNDMFNHALRNRCSLHHGPSGIRKSLPHEIL